MKTILTAIFLLTAASLFAEDVSLSASQMTNSLVNTNEPSGYKPRKTASKADAYTGATHKSKRQKQSNP